MRILFVTLYYPPDGGPSAPLVGMLSEDLVSMGHTVTVIACVPHFPSGKVESQYRRWLCSTTVENGVKVVRLRVPSGNRTKLLHRVFVFASFQILSAISGVFRRFDLLFINNPAITTFLPFLILGQMRKKPALLFVWDLYPEIGQQLGIFKRRWQVRLVKGLEDYCLHRASRIHVLGPKFVTPLKQRGVDPDDIFVTRPWIDTEFIRPLPRQNDFASGLDLDGAFVVLYAGNLGYSQGLETIVDIADMLRHEKRIRFLIVGDGPRKDWLVETAQARKIDNMRFLPFQPRTRLPELLATADIALVSLGRNILDESLPSKLFPLLGSGRPVLALAKNESDLSHLLIESGAGVAVEPGDAAAAARAINQLFEDVHVREEMGRRGRLYATTYLSRSYAAKIVEKEVLKSIDGHGSETIPSHERDCSWVKE